MPQSINKRPKLLYKINLKQTKGIRPTGDTSKGKQNCYFYLIPSIFIFIYLLNLLWTSTNNSRPKLAKSVQPFSSFSETNEQQFIFIYTYIEEEVMSRYCRHRHIKISLYTTINIKAVPNYLKT